MIVDTVRKWKHLVTGSHVSIITDQRNVSFIFNVKHSTKIKHEKLACWRLELSVFNYDALYQGWPNCGSLDSCCVCVQCCSVGMCNLQCATLSFGAGGKVQMPNFVLENDGLQK